MNSHQGTLVVTGGSGLIGSGLALALSDRYHLVAFDNAGPPHPPAEIDAVNVDLTSDSSVAGALEEIRRLRGGRIESVVHLAAYYDFSGAPSPLYKKFTVGGTERLLRSLRGFDVGQFVFATTSLVFGPSQPEQPQAEDAPLEPKWDYPRSKVEAERSIRELHGSMPVAILRISAVYDEQGHSPPLVNHLQRIAERWLTGRVYPGDATHRQSYVHREDLIDAIQRDLGLLHGQERRARAIPKAVAKALAWLLNVLPGTKPFIRPWMIDLADDHLELDSTRARTLLDWRPRRSVRSALPAMVAAFRADPAGFCRVDKLSPPPKPAETFGSAKAG